MGECWYDIDLEALPNYEVWKTDSVAWALTVNWARLNDLIRSSLTLFPPRDPQAGWPAARSSAELTAADLEGLSSLYMEPIYATPAQISSGGHRITAMRSQGVRWAIGQCYLDDIGAGVDELHAYPPADL